MPQFEFRDANPLRQLRTEGLGLTVGQFAHLCGCSTASVSYAENGREKITPKIITKMRELGFDVDTMEQLHTAFCDVQKERLESQVRERLSSQREVLTHT